MPKTLMCDSKLFEKDLSGRIYIVTGANSGSGFATTKQLAEQGADVVGACRRVDAGKKAFEELTNSRGSVEIMEMDLASLASVRRFAKAFLAKHNRLDGLVNNAGVMHTPEGKTEDGFESQFGTNHLGHFALTGLLIDLLLKIPGSRVVNVSSNAHRSGVMDFENLMFESGEGYSPHRAYGRSKLPNLMFTYELQRSFEANKVAAIALAAHPGGSNTNLHRYGENLSWFRLVRPLAMGIVQSAAMGALPTIRAAVDPNVRGGEYYGLGGFRGLRGYPVLVQSTEASHNQADARRLWQVSEQLTGVRYTLKDE